jgi:DnaJ-class molecular chaperone
MEKAMADERCHRCGGKGLFTTIRRTHLGVPGLCFRCDGTGVEPDTLPDAYVKAAASYYQGAQA